MGLDILIVEDDALLAEAVSDYFGSKEWNVTIASDGDRPLELFAEHSYQLILLDWKAFRCCRFHRQHL